MKRNALVMFALLATSTTTLATENTAETATEITPEVQTTSVMNGLRLDIRSASLEADMKVKFDLGDYGGTDISKDSTDIDRSFVLGVGYQEINTNRLGYSVSFVHTNMKEDDATIRENSIEANGTLGASENVYLAAGLKIGKLDIEGDKETEEIYDDLGIGIGYQLAAGIKVNKNMAVEAKYQSVTYNGDLDLDSDAEAAGMSAELEMKISGLSIGLNSTF